MCPMPLVRVLTAHVDVPNARVPNVATLAARTETIAAAMCMSVRLSHAHRASEKFRAATWTCAWAVECSRQTTETVCHPKFFTLMRETLLKGAPTLGIQRRLQGFQRRRHGCPRRFHSRLQGWIQSRDSRLPTSALASGLVLTSRRWPSRGSVAGYLGARLPAPSPTSVPRLSSAAKMARHMLLKHVMLEAWHTALR